ncbi:hypothetical protein PHJA_001073500 [Phtheirospermum japonicum]|uniref:Uncharacterized protein n=1 Tax=Phtheirospermum japonicum TaxID=374723 RepID=A0A830BWG1_9LAMI|nr:hypothetical protein PHJA_001073500 [Phtheirospermum japonicum]
MGYVLRVRFASFFTGAALASAAGLYFLQKDYKIAHHAISQQVFLLIFFCFLYVLRNSDSILTRLRLRSENSRWV